MKARGSASQPYSNYFNILRVADVITFYPSQHKMQSKPFELSSIKPLKVLCNYLIFFRVLIAPKFPYKLYC